jgi:RTA1 like protein
MSSNPWNFIAFATQLLALILAPTFVAAAVSITFKYFVLHYDPDISPIRPNVYRWLFVGSDIVSIVIQGAGAFVAAAATSGDPPNKQLSDVSVGLLITGVSFQVANMLVCGGLMIVYWRRYKNRPSRYVETDADSGRHIMAAAQGAANHSQTRLDERKVRIFVFSIMAAFVVIIIRSIYR